MVVLLKSLDGHRAEKKTGKSAGKVKNISETQISAQTMMFDCSSFIRIAAVVSILTSSSLSSSNWESVLTTWFDLW